LRAFEPYAVRVRYRPVAQPDEKAALAAADLARQIYRWAAKLADRA
jgi:hypothetical protein